MKYHSLISLLVLTAVSGCTQLSPEDRAMISSVGQSAQEAKQQSAIAAQEARAARADADAAAKDAKAASDKADKIFRAGQNK